VYSNWAWYQTLRRLASSHLVLHFYIILPTMRSSSSSGKIIISRSRIRWFSIVHSEGEEGSSYWMCCHLYALQIPPHPGQSSWSIMRRSAAPIHALFHQPPTATTSWTCWRFVLVVIIVADWLLPHQRSDFITAPPWHSIEGWGVAEVYQGWEVDWEMGVSPGNILYCWYYYGAAVLDFGGMKECWCTDLVDADGRRGIVDAVDRLFDESDNICWKARGSLLT